MVYTVDSVNPQRVDKFMGRFKVKIQVTGSWTIRFAPTKTELQLPTPNGAIDGLQLTGPMTVPLEWEWCGEMWAIGSQGNAWFVMCVPGHRESNG